MPDAVAKIYTEGASSGGHLGTAFAVTDELILTAFHCVGDRTAGGIVHSRVLLDFGDDHLIAARYRGGDTKLDFAAFTLDEPPPSGLRRLPLTLDIPPKNAEFAVTGFADVPGVDIPVVRGTITRPEATIFRGTPAIQLSCFEAGTGMSLHGLSGAPVLVGEPEVVVGLVRWNPESAEGRNVGGMVFACPISAVIHRIPELRQCVRPYRPIGADWGTNRAERSGQDTSSALHVSDELAYRRWLADILRSEVTDPDEPSVIPLAARFTARSKWRSYWDNLARRTGKAPISPAKPQRAVAHPRTGLSYTSDLVRSLLNPTNRLPFSRTGSGNMVVLGDPGSGKTVVLREVAATVCMAADERRPTQHMVPVLVSLGGYVGWDNANQRIPEDLLRYIQSETTRDESVAADPLHHPAQAVARCLPALLTTGRLLLLLDGLDELPADGHGERSEAIRHFISLWSSRGNRFLVSCRTQEYDGSLNMKVATIQPLDRRRIDRYLRQALNPTGGAIARMLFENAALRALATNPFFLSAFAYVASSEDSGHLPNNRPALMDLYVSAMIDRRAPNIAHDREALNAFRALLAQLAYEILQRRTLGTSADRNLIEDMATRHSNWDRAVRTARQCGLLTVGIRPDRSGKPVPVTIRFRHQRFQDFFAALEIARQIDDGADAASFLRGVEWYEALVMAIPWIREPARELRLLIIMVPRI